MQSYYNCSEPNLFVLYVHSNNFGKQTWDEICDRSGLLIIFKSGTGQPSFRKSQIINCSHLSQPLMIHIVYFSTQLENVNED